MATTVQDFYKRNPNYVGEANTANRYGAPQQQQSKKGSGRLGKSGLSAWISELSGTGGVAGGAAAGAALGSVVPGIGTALGAIGGGFLGGFAGGTGGRLVENQLRDNEYRLGDALKEGGLTAALSLIPGGKAAKGVASVGDDAIRAGGKLTRTGNAMRGFQRGIKPGNNGLSTAVADAQNAAIDAASRSFKGVGKSSQITQIEKQLYNFNKKYAGSKEAKKIFSDDSALDILTRFQNNIDNNPSLAGKLTGQSRKTYDNLVDEFAKLGGKTNKDFVDFVASKVNKRYRTVSSGGAAGSAESQIYEAARDASKGFIDEKFATRSGINKQLSTLLGAEKSLGKAITRDTGAGAGQGMTLGRMISDVAGPTLDVVGRGAQQLGKGTNTTFARQLTRQVGGRAVLGTPGSIGEEPVTPDAYSDIASNPTGLGGALDTSMPPEQSAYGLEQALADASQLLGPNATPPQYLSYAKALMEQNGGQSMSAAEQKAARQAETATQGLTQLQQLYSQAGGGQNRLPGILSSVEGALGTNSKAQAYNKIRDSLTTSLARAFGETGVLTDQDREVYKQALPRLDDTPEEAQIKIQYLMDMLAGGGGQVAPQDDQLQQYQETYGELY